MLDSKDSENDSALLEGRKIMDESSESAPCYQGEESNLCGLSLLLGIWGCSHGLGCACLSPFHPDPVLQDSLICFLSDPLISGPGILVASIPIVSQGNGSDFSKWGQRAIFCDQLLAPGTGVLGI